MDERCLTASRFGAAPDYCRSTASHADIVFFFFLFFFAHNPPRTSDLRTQEISQSIRKMSPNDSSRPATPPFSLSEPVDLIVGITAAALTGNQLLKASSSHDHKTSHLLKAGLGAAVAAGAFTMLRGEHEKKQNDNRKSRHGNDASRSPSPPLRGDSGRGRTDGGEMRGRYGDRLLPGGPRRRGSDEGLRARSSSFNDRRDMDRRRHLRAHSTGRGKLDDEILIVDAKGQVYGQNASYYFPDLAERLERRR